MRFTASGLLILGLFTVINVFAQKKCIPKVYRGPDNPMNCVCNSTYCDEFPPLGNLGANQAAVYTSSQSGKRFERTIMSFDPSATPNTIKIAPNDSQTYQTILGFGGAFTDAAGINIARLSQGAQQNLLKAYFGSEGIGYTIGRTPIGSCDFSTHVYSYDDVSGDFALENFSLTNEDYQYKIPFIKMAQNIVKLQNQKFKLFASPWSAPAWMKTNDQEGHGGHLINNASYYQTWSNYFVRFFEEYSKNGVTFWGVTMQNEPVASSSFQSMLFNSSQERDFAKNYWGQTMRSNPTTNNLKLMILDDNRQRVTDYTDTVFNDTDSSKYIDGCAIHWYNDDATRPESLTTTHEKHPDKFLLYTEACNEGGVKPGQWSQADNYMKHIMPVLQNWVVGWTDWNLCLDPRGGPNWDNNFVDSPIIVSNTSNEFEKQPMYYALGHIAKFIVPDSVMIANHISGLNSNTKQLIESIAAVNPAGQKVIVINNRDVATSYPVSIVNKKGAVLNLNLEASSFTSIVYSD